VPEFQYTARDPSGGQVIHRQSAESREALIRELRQQGLLVLEVTLAKAKAGGRRLSLNPFAYLSLNSLDVERSFYQLSVLLRSGLPIVEALEFIRDFSRPGARRVWQTMVERISDGDSLSAAMAEHKVFMNMTLQLVRVGENSGQLDHVLEQASLAMERRRLNRKQVLAALRYPAFMILFVIGIVMFMMKKLIPELKKFINTMGGKLPPITQALIDVSNWFELYTGALLVGMVGFVITVMLLYQVRPIRFQMDRFILNVPVFGHLFRLSGTTTLAQNLGILLSSGVRILDALVTIESLIGNRFLASKVRYARERVALGSSLAEPLTEDDAFMPMLTRMIRVGEKSGRLDVILGEMGRHFEVELQAMIVFMSSLIGPMMTIIVGGIIGFVYAAFLVAMFAAGSGSNK
jgi:type IV pilus assembly protein PilC